MSEKLTMTVDIRAQLNQFNSAMDTAKEILNKTFSGKGIKTYTDELNKVGRIFDKIARTTAGPIDSKATFGQMQKEVMDATQRLENLRDAISNIRNLTFEQRLSFLPDDFDKNFKKATIAAEKYSSAIKSIPKNINSFSLEGVGDGLSFKKLGDEIGNAKRVLGKVEELENKIADKEAERASINEKLSGKRQLQEIIAQEKALEERNKAEEKYQQLLEKSQKSKRKVKITEDDIIDTAAKLKEGQGAEGAINRAIQGRNLSSETQASLVQFLKNSTGGKLPTTKPTSNIDKGLANKGKDILELAEAYNEAQQAQANFIAAGGEESKVEELKARSLEEDEKQLATLTTTTEGLEQKLTEVNKDINAYNNELDSKREKEQEARETVEKYTKAQEELQKVFDAKNAEDRSAALQEMTQTLEMLGIDTSQLGDLSGKSDKEIKTLVQSLYDEQVVTKQVEEILPEMIKQTEELANHAEETSLAINKESEAFDKLSERSENIDRLTARVKQFTGFVGVINIARKAMRDALSTVKELDKAMTSMAVVTKSTVSDYWEQLPEYTARANKLGATIRDMYEADTLYYQQGLKTNQVMQVANETMKMARIAGLGAAEATDRMTNALRGFNMAINEDSAQRINDVYSKLAAITASNVDEISTAMTKTASIANSAGMEFETTAAFLSQIIETTRESAETAGTALKTVIARFQELKKAPSEIGEVEGEIVDANKIEGALRTVGVALRDSEGQFRKLDDVFMELAGKWSNLDKNTQRYIATIAAGSRQQSRFIALMQDYSHTVELVDAAYTSAGTSQQQYEKTLESMETILKRLQNSWDTFTMSLFNSNVLKGLATVATGLLNALNKILDFIDVGNLGVVKIAAVILGINKLGVAFKIFTNQLKQDSGTILNSFGAIGTALDQWWKNFGKISSDTDKVSQAMRNYTQATTQATIAEQTALKTELALANAKEKLATAEANLTKFEGKKTYAAQAGKVTKQTGVVSALTNQNKLDDVAKGNAIAAATKAYKEANEALIQYGKSLQLSSKQAERFSELVLNSNTALEDTQRVTALAAIATDEETAAELLNNKEKLASITTDELQQTTEVKHLAVRELTNAQLKVQAILNSKLIKILTLGLSAKFADIAADKTKEASAKGAAKGVGAFNAAVLASIGIMAAVAAAAFLIYNIIKGILKSRLSERLKAAQDHLDNTADAIKECKEALADLEDQQEKYKSLHEELNKNIQGTEEWKKKLIECNEQVYDLIQQYPTLVNYIKRASSGELVISDEGWDAIIKQGQEKLENARIANYTAQKEVFELSQKDSFKKIGEKLLQERNLEGALPIDALRETLQSSSNIGEGLKEFGIKEFDLSPELLKSLNEWKGSVIENTKALSIIGDSINNGEFENSLEQAGANFITNAYLKTQKETEQVKGTDWLAWGNRKTNRAANILDSGNLGADFRDNKYFKEIAAFYKVSGFTGNDREDLAKLYAASQGIAVNDDIRTRAKLGNDRVGLINELLKTYDTKKREEEAEGIAKNTTNLELLGRASQVSSLRMSDLDALQDLYTSEDTPEEIKKQLDEQLKAAGVNKFSQLYGKEFIKIMGENQLTSADLSEMSKILTLDQLDDYAKLLSREKAAGLGTTDFSSILSKENGAEIISKLFTFDTSSLEDLKLARKTLISEWPEMADEINILIDSISRFGGAVSKVDLQTLIDRTKALSKELANLNDYKQGSVFTEEQKKKYIDNGIAEEEDFLQDVDGNYVYLKPLETLEQAIKDNTAALEKRSKDLDDQYTLVEKYHQAENDIKNNPYYNIDTFLKNNQSLLGSLGIEGVGPNTNYDKLAPAIKQQIQDKLVELVETTNLGTKEEKQKEITNALSNAYSSTGTGATNLENLFKTGNINAEAIEKAGILNLLEGEEGYDALIQQLNELKAAGKGSEEEYKKFLKTLSNKKDITIAQKGIKNLISTSQTFATEYEEAGNNAELKMAEVLDQAKQFGLDGTKITEQNYELYADLFTQFGEGNYEAYQGVANLLLAQQGLTQDQIAQFWAGDLEITKNGLEEIATMAQAFGLGFTEIVGDKSYLKGWSDTSGFVSKSGKGGSKDEWEDPYNWLWNINKRINKEIFERERLERAYQKAVEDTTKSEEDLYNLSKKELENLERQAVLERDKGQKAIQEAQMMMKQRPEFGNYVSWNTETGQIQVDYNKIDKENWGSARGEAFEAFVSRLEELNDEVQDSQVTLEEIEDLTEDIKNRGRDQYIELQDRIKNALVEINQREIDTTQKINDSIKTAQDALLNKIQEEISETRQIRSNQEKEQELEDKRQRLSYLRRDTTGANAVQIRQLEEELRKGEQSYTDSLTDQTISNIQKANQKAEEQRTEQIEIMNNQLTRWQETGAIWDTVNTSINEGFNNPDSFLNSNVASLIASAENRRALSEIQQADWDKELENQAKLAELFNNGQLYQQGELTLEKVTTCANELYTTMVKTREIGQVNQNMYKHLTDVYPKSYADKVTGNTSSIASGVTSMGKNISSILAALNVIAGNNMTEEQRLDKYYRDLEQKLGYSIQRYKSGDFAVGGRYASGGLNTSTGPAWLDGTPTKPEYVLNADQTKAFFDLVNTLTGSDSAKGGVSGDNYFDIDINVDKIDSDYDVDKMAARIKEQIWEDSQYRNVNLVSLLR